MSDLLSTLSDSWDTIIAAAAAIIASVFSLLSARSANRGALAATRAAAELEADSAAANARREKIDEQTRKVLSCIEAFIGALQSFRDAILMLTSVETISREEPMSAATKAKDAMQAVYEEAAALVADNVVRGHMHAAKNEVFAAYTMIQRAKDSGSLDEKQKQFFIRSRAELAECQQLLRDERARLIVRLLS